MMVSPPVNPRPISVPASSPGVELNCALWEGAGGKERRVLVFSHGWGGAPRFDDLLLLLASRGWAVLRIEHRGYGESAAKKNLPAWRTDMLAAARFLLEERKNAALWLAGHSTGGTATVTSAALALREKIPVAGFLALAPFRSLPAILRDNPSSREALEGRFGELAPAQEAADAERAAGELRGVPGVIVHGTADEAVPFAHGETLARLAGEKTGLIRVERGDHLLAAADQSPSRAALLDLIADGIERAGAP